MGNSFIEDLIADLIRAMNSNTRFSEVEKRIVVNRLLPPPTQEERELARAQVLSEEE